MVFCFVQNLFFRQHESQNNYFFCRARREFFSPEFNIRLYDKNFESDYFFSSTKNRIFFSATLGIRIFFLEKKPYPPPSPLVVKWSVPKTSLKISSLKIACQSLTILLQPYHSSKSVDHTFLFQNRIGDVMVSVLALSEVGCWFEPLPGPTLK